MSGFASQSRVAAAGATVASVATLLAAPWLCEELAVSAVIAVAAALLLVRRSRGWAGELAGLLTAGLALAIAFHWAPGALAHAMGTTTAFGLAFTAPIVAWDAVRTVAPFWLAARVVDDPRDAWLPAALAAVVLEAVMPAIFPWKLGLTMVAWPITVQAVDLFGTGWATFVLFAHAGVVVALAAAVDRRLGGGRLLDPARRAARAWSPAAVAAAVVGLNAAYGAWAVSSWGAAGAAAPRLRVALVQADPDDEDALRVFQRLTHEAAADGRFDLVCWPECSGGSYEACLASFADEQLLRRHSRPPRRGIKPLDAAACPLLFGGQIYEGLPEKPRVLYQSAILMDRSAALAGAYHKRHLMPFGEYVPWAEQFPELKLYFPLVEEYSVGREATVLGAGAARIGPLLCYEDMVPSAAASLVRNSANLLVALINGSFFTASVTLEQHRLLAQLRAVENRRCLLRCAATGETCVVSPVGTVTARLPLVVLRRWRARRTSP